ncbi:GNAT family N-acetyltransferase [Amorphus sp. 3PC139-8]|uniref:GNAT family N-acetyltransferase n=1 Tax=Amorphus sp. 3PC139-8 TaxID=2735676 RepID=UPI00345D4E02
MPEISIRPLDAEDGPHLARIFFCAVYDGTRAHYSFRQRRAWAGDAIMAARWQEAAEMTGFVAQLDDEPVGFMTIDAAGHIEFAFVLPSLAGTGIGWRLYEAVEAKARDFGATALTVEASEIAKPFFERQGWTAIARQSVTRRDVTLTNYKMEKVL